MFSIQKLNSLSSSIAVTKGTEMNSKGTVVTLNDKVLRANAQKNRANRGHSLKPNPPSYLVYNKVLRSL